MRRKNEDAGAERHLHLLFCEKGGGKIDTRKRITIRLPQDVYRDILDNLGNAASSTFNSFMTNAARFYLGYIKANHFAEYALGKLHADETSPFFDETKAADWFERAAEHGNGFAKYRLAKCFLNGKGRAVDAGSAARLFAEAAQASDVSVRRFVTPWAKYQLGKLYIRGNGVPRDWAKAEELLRSAAQDGNEFAQRLLQRRAQWHRLGPMDAALGVIGSLCRMFETSAPHIRPRCMYLDRKRRRELEQKQRALGHAENDFEPQM